MKRSDCARRLGWFELAKPSHRVPQFGEKPDALMSIIIEKGFEPGILGRLRGLFITALAILERSDQVIDRTYDVRSLIHIILVRATTGRCAQFESIFASTCDQGASR